MISFAAFAARASTTEGRNVASKSREFQLGMTTVADSFEQRSGAGSTLRGRSAASKSATAIPTTAIRISSGEINSKGRNLIKRHRMVRSVLTGPRFSRLDNRAETDLSSQLQPA